MIIGNASELKFKIGDIALPLIGRYENTPCEVVAMEKEGSFSGWFTVRAPDGQNLLYTGDELKHPLPF